MATAPATTGDAAGWPSPRQAWYAVFIFGLTLLVNFLDRGIITLLVEPLKHDLGLSDEQVGVLMGLAFVCFYVVLGLPIARLVDSVRRATILTVGLACWSVATALCGLAGSFGQLFAFRVGVGVGEACSGPATYSMLADLFPPWKLPRAIAFMQVGFFAGNAAALIVGGAIVTLLLALPPMTLPLVGTLHGWQLAFLLASVPGLIVTALLFDVFHAFIEPLDSLIAQQVRSGTHANLRRTEGRARTLRRPLVVLARGLRKPDRPRRQRVSTGRKRGHPDVSR